MKFRLAALLFLALYAVVFLAPGLFSLPPLDRDEARFAQATKQMLETGDLVEIRYQDSARNKKPVGIYWMQAASAEALGGPEAAPIWAYRLPSALGAILAVIFTYLAGAALLDRRAAALGAMLFAISMLLIAEGHIAKTDAMQCAAITAMMAGLARAFARHRENPAAPGRWSDMVLTWSGLGLAALIKGPVGLMVGGTAILGVWLLGGGVGWMKKTRPLIGVPMALLVFSPWAIAITIQTGGQFWYDAVFGDMLSKVGGVQEKHGGFPGYYTLLVWLTLFPASLLLLPAAWRTVAARKEGWAIFLIAWALPTWIIFEILPTKLPHYTLPVYPALALAIGAYLHARLKGEADEAPAWARIANIVLWGVIALALATAMVVIPQTYGEGLRASDILLALVVLIAAATLVIVVLRRRWERFMLAAGLVAALVFGGLFERTIPGAQDLDVSRRLATAVTQLGWKPGAPLAATGYHEPSLVFLTATDIQLVDDGAAAAAFLKANPTGIAMVESRQVDAFLRAASAAGLKPYSSWSVNGFNYSRGQRVTLGLFRLRPPP